MRFGIIHQRRYVVSRGLAIFHSHGECSNFLVISVIDSIYSRQSKLTLAHVIARRLANTVVGIIVKNVVPDLETKAYNLAKTLGTRHILSIGASRYGPQFGTSRKERRRFVVNDMKISLLGDSLVADISQLANLALRKRATQARNNLHHPDVARHGSLQQRSRQQVVAHQHRHFVVIHSVHRALSASFATLVHHIVVHKRGCVQQFERHRRAQRVNRNVPQFTSHQHHQQRAHHFALTPAHIVERLAQKIIIVSQCVVKQSLVLSHLLQHRLANCC